MDLSIDSLPFIFVFIYVTIALVIVVVVTFATFLQNRFVASQMAPSATEMGPEISKISATREASAMQDPLQVQLTIVIQQVADYKPSSAPEVKQPSATQQPSLFQETSELKEPTEPEGSFAYEELPVIKEPSTTQEVATTREDAETAEAPVIQELATTTTTEASVSPETSTSETQLPSTYTLMVRHAEMEQTLRDMQVALRHFKDEILDVGFQCNDIMTLRHKSKNPNLESHFIEWHKLTSKNRLDMLKLRRGLEDRITDLVKARDEVGAKLTARSEWQQGYQWN